MARQGKYEESVASLLEPDVWRGLNIADYNLWAAEIWNILALRACRQYVVLMLSSSHMF